MARWPAVRLSQGVGKAKAHLDALGAAYPDMPAFGESQYEPMPDVEIDPEN